MKNLRSKMKDQKGFTLIEMLIVVAIIAILISVSIPMVSASLEKTKRATDAANERSAKGAALTAFLTGSTESNQPFTGGDLYYGGKTGKVYTNNSGDTIPTSDQGYGQCKQHKGGYIKVSVSAEGVATVTWMNYPSTGGSKNPHDGDITKVVS